MNKEIKEEIVFDANSGISEEEQREILEKINGIAEKNRQSLSSGTEPGVDGGKKKKGLRRFKAKKSGGLFPIMVNIAAVAALAAGFYALYTLHGKTDAHVREGTKVYNSAERALIEEIRRETSSRIEEKENEIKLISSQLEEINAELREFYSSDQKNADRQTAENRLKALQENYLAAMGRLQNERSQILEESRAREAEIQAQAKSRAGESAHNAEQASAAQAELDRLSAEQTQAAAVEAQMGAFFSNLNSQIAENKFNEAAETVKAMKDFLNAPAFQSLRSVQARKDMYAQAINSFETMIEEARRNSTPEDERLAELEKKNTELEKDLAEKDKTIDALSSQGSGTARRLNDLNNTLQKQNSQLAADLDKQTKEKNNQINSLKTERDKQLAEKDNQIASLKTDRDNQIAEKDRQITEKDNQIASIRADNTRQVNDLNLTIRTQGDSLGRIKGIVSGKNIDAMALADIRESFVQIQNVMEGQ